MKTINNKEILKIELFKDVNYSDRYELWLRISGDPQWPQCKNIKDFIREYPNKGSHLFYGENDGLCEFYLTDDYDREHGPNYHWSSRPGVINQVLPKEEHITNCVLNGWATGISLKKLKELLPSEYYICSEISCGEPSYYIKKLD